jgi:hypothetical protein
VTDNSARHPGNPGVPGRQAGDRDAAIKMTRAVHTLAWFAIESCVLYLLYTGFAGRSGRRPAIAAGVVAGEALVFAANGFRCPLTDVAERLGADHGSVTDTYLPARLARHLPAIHVPLLLIAAFLHRRNIRRNAAGACHAPGPCSQWRLAGDAGECQHLSCRAVAAPPPSRG